MKNISSLIADINFNIINEAKEQDIPYADQITTTDDGGIVVANFISGLLRIAFVVAAVILLFNLLYAGIQWISAGGDSGKIDKAKNRLTQSVVGILILSASVAIFMAINTFLGHPVEFISGRTSGDGGGGTPPAVGSCECWNGKYAPEGSVGRLYNTNDSPCYRCVSGSWTGPIGGTCGVITCY